MAVYKFNRDKDIESWNEFVSSAKNQTFLFNRGFMDYHMEKFDDHSLIITDEKENMIAVLPANVSRTNKAMVVSHEGLTYGGLVLLKDVKLKTVIRVFHDVLKYYSSLDIAELRLKSFPSFYNTSHTDEIEYINFLLNARLYRRDIALVIDQAHRIHYTGNIRREGNKAEKAGAVIKERQDMSSFWNEVLVPNLQSRYGVDPVHSVEEINRLKKLFPESIRQFDVLIDGNIVAGATIFYANGVAHCQYISANEEGRQTGALNFLFKHLVDIEFSDSRYFDFGIVNENSGLDINEGMLFWKESFGGRSRKHDFYSINTSDFKLLAKYI